MFKIIATKPASTHPEDVIMGYQRIVVLRENGEFVSATATDLSLAAGEWFWGNYFKTLEEAMAHFNSRQLRGPL